MTNTINNRQIFMFLFLVIPSNVMIISHNLAKVALRGGWISILIGTIVFAVSTVFICKLQNMFQGKTIVEYSKDIVGKKLSYILIIYIIIYFILVFDQVCDNYFAFFKIEFYYKTPEIALLIVGMIAFGFISSKGITPVIRTAEIIIPIYILFTFTFYIWTLVQGMRYNILPLFSKDEISDYFKGCVEVIIPFLGAEMLFIIPFTEANKKSPKVSFFTVLFIGVYYVLVYMSTIGIVGINAIQINIYAGFEALKSVDIPVIERIDVLYETVGFATIFFKISFFYLIIVELVCRALPKQKRWIIVVITGFVLTILVTITYVFNLTDFIGIVLKILGVFTAILLPIALFIIAKLKNKNTENKAKNEIKENA